MRNAIDAVRSHHPWLSGLLAVNEANHLWREEYSNRQFSGMRRSPVFVTPRTALMKKTFLFLSLFSYEGRISKKAADVSTPGLTLSISLSSALLMDLRLLLMLFVFWSRLSVSDYLAAGRFVN